MLACETLPTIRVACVARGKLVEFLRCRRPSRSQRVGAVADCTRQLSLFPTTVVISKHKDPAQVALCDLESVRKPEVVTRLE